MVSEAFSPGFRRTVPVDDTFEKAATGFIFIEGPVWNFRDRYLILVNITGDTIWK